MHTMIVMMGGQGVGKGTFSNMLMSIGDYTHIETGAILRAAPADSDIAKTIARGELVTDELLFDFIAPKIDCGTDIILDGFPRTTPQAQWLVKNYANKFDIQIIYLNVPESVMTARIEKRIREGGGRADDADTAAVRRRLDTFWKITVPAIEWLRTAPGIKFADISVAAPDAETNFAKIRAAIGK